VDRRKNAAYKLYPRDGVVSGSSLRLGTPRRARLRSCCMLAYSHTSCWVRCMGMVCTYNSKRVWQMYLMIWQVREGTNATEKAGTTDLQ